MYPLARPWHRPIGLPGAWGARVDTQSSDAELARAARHDPQAFERLYRRHLPAVFRYVFVRVGAVVDAEDVTSAIFLDVLTSLSHYREQGVFMAWLFTIAQRHVGAHHRRRRRDDARTSAIEAADLASFSGNDGASQGRRLEQLDLLARAMDHLTDDQREALALRFYGGLKVAEIATVMGKGESAVKMIVHRGLAHLRTALAGPGEGAAA